jgi:hypothetical protein
MVNRSVFVHLSVTIGLATTLFAMLSSLKQMVHVIGHSKHLQILSRCFPIKRPLFWRSSEQTLSAVLSPINVTDP